MNKLFLIIGIIAAIVIIAGVVIIATISIETYFPPTINSAKLAIQSVLDNCRENEIALQQGLDINLINYSFKNSTHYINNSICKIIELGPYCSADMIKHLGKNSNLFEDNLEYFMLEWPSLPDSFTEDELHLCIDWHLEKLEIKENLESNITDKTRFTTPFSGEDDYKPNMTREERLSLGYKLYPGGWIAPDKQNQVEPIYRINPETGEEFLDLDAMIKQYEGDFEIDYTELD